MGGERPEQLSDAALRQRFEDRGQEHVFRFWDGLGGSERARLWDQASAIDLASLERNCIAARAPTPELPELEPLEVERLPEFGGGPARLSPARARGGELLASGRVAVLVVAGGQARRLGIDAPKGAFPLGPVSGRPLFAIQAQKIRGLCQDESGELFYWAGNAAIHLFATSFAQRVAADAECWLPYHASAEKIPGVDAEGRAVAPDEPNGWKFERFVFDALPAAERVFGVPLPPEGTPIEIDHSKIDAPGDARALGIRSLADADEAVRVGPGVEA